MDILSKLVQGQDLTSKEAECVMQDIMSGNVNPVHASAFLISLKMKGETIEEISAFAKVMRENAVNINPKAGMLVDTCGTGGDSSNSFNISTTAAFVAAGTGVAIAKHGNRSVSSNCGSADVLEELGVRMLEPKQVEKCIEKIGIGFMFAPFFHPAMKNIMPVRKDLGVRTVFNILGPLTNPANAKAQVLGVFDPELTETMASVLASLGTKHALVVHSDGMDEIGLGKTKVSELKQGKVNNYTLDAKKLEVNPGKIPKVSSKKESAELMLEILGGKQQGAARDIVVLNAAAAIYVSGKADSIEQGLKAAYQSIDSGNAMNKLQELIQFKGE